MHMFTVLEQINFEGKTVRPVCTHEGSGMGRSEADLKKCCQGAVIKKGLAIQGSSVGRCDAALKKLPFRNCVPSKNEPINIHF